MLFMFNKFGILYSIWFLRKIQAIFKRELHKILL